ncbi:MAG: glycosyltransferase family 4 protein [Acidobacteriota bacterium]
MSRPTLLYASPFPPEKSGIADYSEALVNGLAQTFDLTLVSQHPAPVLRSAGGTLKARVIPPGEAQPQAFDHVLYNFGNNPYFHAFIYDLFLHHPGPVILHDVVLYFLTVGYYQESESLFSKIYELAGPAGVRAIKEQLKAGQDLLRFGNPSRLPLNGEILALAPRIIVHSEFARASVLKQRPQAEVFTLPMVDPYSVFPPSGDHRGLLRQRFGVPDGAPVVASFGIIAPTKQNHLILKAVESLSRSGGPDPYSVMVGEGDYVDGMLGKRIIKTGHLDAGEYAGVLDRCDLVAALRHPSMGETSLGLIQALSRGKPCLVTGEAWFGELPDDIVVKVPAQITESALAHTIRTLLEDTGRQCTLGGRAGAWAREHHDIQVVSTRLAALLLRRKEPATGARGRGPAP